MHSSLESTLYTRRTALLVTGQTRSSHFNAACFPSCQQQLTPRTPPTDMQHVDGKVWEKRQVCNLSRQSLRPQSFSMLLSSDHLDNFDLHCQEIVTDDLIEFARSSSQYQCWHCQRWWREFYQPNYQIPTILSSAMGNGRSGIEQLGSYSPSLTWWVLVTSVALMRVCLYCYGRFPSALSRISLEPKKYALYNFPQSSHV